jgi:tyrosinase
VNSVPQIVPTISTKFKGCIRDGPFADLTLRMGPGKLNTTHCLTRGIDNTLQVRLNSAAVANTTKQHTFEDFRVQLEGQPVTDTPRMHDGGHFAVGGDMSNFYSSPGGRSAFFHFTLRMKERNT